MSTPITKERYQVIWLIRRLFRALSQQSSKNLAHLGISAADRAVLEFLYPDKSLSVPEIARRYQVSRQHIQVTVNALLDGGLLATRDNPRHKRSPLILLRKQGRALFERIFSQDEKAIAVLFSEVDQRHLQITRQTLQALLEQLE